MIRVITIIIIVCPIYYLYVDIKKNATTTRPEFSFFTRILFLNIFQWIFKKVFFFNTHHLKLFIRMDS